MNTEKKTIFDIIPTPEKEDKLYEAVTVQEVFGAMEDIQRRKPFQNYVNIKLNYKIYDLRHTLLHKHGLKFTVCADSYGNATHYRVQFSGHILWVYYLNTIPVYFTDVNSLLATPPHSSTNWKPDFLFDSFERIKF